MEESNTRYHIMQQYLDSKLAVMVATQPQVFDYTDLFMAVGTASFDVQFQQAVKRLEANRIADRIRFNESMTSLRISSPLKEVRGKDSGTNIHHLSVDPNLGISLDVVSGIHFGDAVIKNDTSATVNVLEIMENPENDSAQKVFDKMHQRDFRTFHMLDDTLENGNTNIDDVLGRPFLNSDSFHYQTKLVPEIMDEILEVSQEKVLKLNPIEVFDDTSMGLPIVEVALEHAYGYDIQVSGQMYDSSHDIHLHGVGQFTISCVCDIVVGKVTRVITWLPMSAIVMTLAIWLWYSIEYVGVSQFRVFDRGKVALHSAIWWCLMFSVV